MAIEIAGPATVTVQGPEVVFVFEDTGGALVSFLLLIRGDPAKPPIAPVRYREPSEDSGGEARTLDPGTYQCFLQITAIRGDGAFGTTYQSVASVDAEVFGTAAGVVPKNPGGAFGSRRFQLVVT
jgi:hypothetical protein